MGTHANHAVVDPRLIDVCCFVSCLFGCVRGERPGCVTSVEDQMSEMSGHDLVACRPELVHLDAGDVAAEVSMCPI